MTTPIRIKTAHISGKHPQVCVEVKSDHGGKSVKHLLDAHQESQDFFVYPGQVIEVREATDEDVQPPPDK